jgi:hypothetical protein
VKCYIDADERPPLNEKAFDAFIVWWDSNRFPNIQRPDPRVGAAYEGFLAGYEAAQGASHEGL